MAQEEAARRNPRTEIDGQGQSISRPRCADNWRRRKGRARVDVARSYRRGSADRASSLCRSASKTKLRADILRKRARSGHYASFDFNLLRLAIKLMQQVVNHGDNRWNVANDQLVRTLIREDCSARGKELFQRCGQSACLAVAEDARKCNGRNGLRLRLLQIPH